MKTENSTVLRKWNHTTLTIKQRLVISNILMFIIPLVIALVVALGGLSISWSIVNKENNNILTTDQEANNSRDEIISLVLLNLDNGTKSSELNKMLSANHIFVEVFDDRGNQIQFGDEVSKYSKLLTDAIQAVGGEGLVTIENKVNNEQIYSEAYAEKKTSKGIDYSICLIYSTKGISFSSQSSVEIIYNITVIVVIISVLLAIIIANRFLTHFVFQKINKSLDILADGVHEISAGNLEYRINYHGKDEFAPICDDFNDMAVQLQRSAELTQKQEQNRKELLAGISHDLRSPLTSIRAYIEGLLDGVAKSPVAQTKYMEIIKTKADDIDHMVSKLFLFSKIDLGDYPYIPELLNLEQETSSFVKAVEEEYKANGLQLSIEFIEPGLFIFADPVQLRSIFGNILENSLNYKNKENAKASFFVKRTGDKVHIMIDDNGPGVPEEALSKLFDVFYRADLSRSNPHKGSGLGLAIVAKTISNIKGNIKAENLEKGGLRMIIELPIVLMENGNEKSINN